MLNVKMTEDVKYYSWYNYGKNHDHQQKFSLPSIVIKTHVGNVASSN